ncbi:MAG: AMP-binding protein [Sphingomonadales bacterium]|nr:AMP-binding protein [Sphingomonadales bacterium]MDE2170945.1 AMP-binding protein [Sphingomonadales bacterium]
MNTLFEAMKRHAAADALVPALDPVTTPPVSRAELLSRVTSLRHGLAPSHRPVALQLDHGPQAVALELALLKSGTPVLSLPAFFTSEQSAHAMVACGARWPEEAEHDPSPSAPTLPMGTARITFTSGSTGTPKGICLSAAQMMQVASSVVSAVGNHHAGRHLALLPPGILLETVAGLFTTMLAGGTYVCPPQAMAGLADPFRPDFAMMAHALATWRITSTILVPEYLAGLVRVLEVTGLRLPDLTILAVGGARVPRELLARAHALGLPLRQGYGLTEAGSVVALEGADADGAGSVGRALDHMGVHLAPDGEIMLDGPLCLGAIGQPPPPCPFPTGDIGRIDDRGRLWIEGRKSNLLITSHGRNISPEWVEEALLAEPEIMQAMVYGDGLPMPRALLVPAHPQADLDTAVARANTRLPAYARVAQWREVAHFTPMNGLLTGNGRLRRKAIAARWLDGEPRFSTRLEAETVRERIAFLSTPQVRAGLAGEVSLGAYIAYLTQAYHHVRHTVPLMRAARARLAHRPELVRALDDYIAEETGHEEWILSDIAAAGGDAQAARHSDPAPATHAMVQHAYDQIATGNPVCFFGMVYVLESISVALAQRGAHALADRLGLPPQAFTYLTSHGALDQDHMIFFADLVDSLPGEEDRQAIVTMARAMFGLFARVFGSIDLEAAHEPA